MSGPSIAKMAVGSARYRLTGHRVPLHVMLAVTRRCTTSCATCAVPMKATEELSTREMLDLIDHLAGLGTARISITGGEPLLRADLPAILGRARVHGIWVSVESNGDLVPARIGDLRGLNQLILGLDGKESVHDQLREPGSFARVEAAVRAARAMGVEVWTQTVLNRKNLDQIPWILDFAEQHGLVASFQAIQGSRTPYGKAADRLQPSPDAMRRAIRELLEARLAGRPVGLSEKTLRYLLTWKDFSQATSIPPHEDLHCMAGQLYCAIDADGTVAPCPLQLGIWAGAQARGEQLGKKFDHAFESLRDNPCKACTSSALTEYNFLYNLNLPSLVEWVRTGRWRDQVSP